MEELVDQAAGEEDFDKAASIQEQIEILRAQLEALQKLIVFVAELSYRSSYYFFMFSDKFELFMDEVKILVIMHIT